MLCTVCSSPHCVVPCLSMSMMSPHIQDSTAWSVLTFVTWIHLTFCQISESLQFNLTRKPKAAHRVEWELELIRTFAESLSWSQLVVKLDWVKPTSQGGEGGVEDNWNRLITPQFTSRLSPLPPLLHRQIALFNITLQGGTQFSSNLTCGSFPCEVEIEGGGLSSSWKVQLPRLTTAYQEPTSRTYLQ